ncbi:MAG: SemiSWEET transporter [Elainellaceae cyanobacterium]
MDQITTLGLLAGSLTTLAYLPQLIKVWRSKSAEDISWAMLIILCTGILMWLIYGTYVHDVPVITANVFTLMFTSVILGLKVHYSRYRTVK